ncbi:MAG: HNH endonuclease [Gammaproteobacteria bacterium]|nr:HNH endonuclease [Gammaproteobacteria bacterium]
MSPHILALDVAGAPHRWISVRHAAHYYATDMVAWAMGTSQFVLRGGIQRATGLQSLIRASSIIAIRGRDYMVRHFDQVPALTKQMLLARDRYVCAYCAQRFRFDQLDMEHIVPKSKGGEDSWMNLVTACKACNNRKADRTPETAGMRLRYVPYVPNRYEAFIMSNRTILADQMEFLLQGVPRSSRMHVA